MLRKRRVTRRATRVYSFGFEPPQPPQFSRQFNIVRELNSDRSFEVANARNQFHRRFLRLAGVAAIVTIDNFSRDIGKHLDIGEFEPVGRCDHPYLPTC